MKRALIAALLALSLASCAWVPSKSCSVGITFFGPVPVPTAGCDLTIEPEDEKDDEEEIHA